jgi:teichuronic acid biosynthesis glycosyltransferase TuaG
LILNIARSETVGVVIPTYNRAVITLRAVNSVLNQSFPPTSIVVVDDGSDEEEFLKLESSLRDLPVSIIRSTHKSNPAIMRNLGIAQLETKWMAFLDSDDLWFENKLETQIALAIKTGSKAICSNAKRLSTQERYLVNTETGYFKLKDLLKGNQIINSSVLIDRKILTEIGGYVSNYNVRSAEDYATWLRIATLTNWFYSADSLVTYDDTSADGLSNIAKMSETDISTHALVDFYNWKNCNQKMKRRIINYAFRTLAKL